MKKLFYLLIFSILLIVTCKKSPTESTFDGTFPDPNFDQISNFNISPDDNSLNFNHKTAIINGRENEIN